MLTDSVPTPQEKPDKTPSYGGVQGALVRYDWWGSPHYPELEAQSNTVDSETAPDDAPTREEAHFQASFAAPADVPPGFDSDRPTLSRRPRPEKAIQLTLPCPSHGIIGQDSNGHTFGRTLICNREWCPDSGCGGNHGKAHNRRKAHYLPLAQQLDSVGYFVLTIPPELRKRYRTQGALSALGTAARRMMQRYGFNRGIRRWHWFGDPPDGQVPTPDKPLPFNPHLNIIVGAAFLDEECLDSIRHSWARILRISLERTNIHYSYAEDVFGKLNKVSYVLRPTFTFYQWDEGLARTLMGFRNAQRWGVWEDAPRWDIPENPDIPLPAPHLAALERNICPHCGQTIVWISQSRAAILTGPDWLDLGDGWYYRLGPPSLYASG